LGKCCDEAPGPLVKVRKGEKTCKINAAALTIFNTYILNKIQDVEHYNTFNFSNAKMTKALGSDAVSNIIKTF